MTQTIETLQQLADGLMTKAGLMPEYGIADGRIRVTAGEDEHADEVRISDGGTWEYHSLDEAEDAIREWVENLAESRRIIEDEKRSAR